MIFAITATVYSLFLVYPFARLFFEGELDLLTTLVGGLILFVLGPLLFAASPMLYHAVVPPKSESAEE